MDDELNKASSSTPSMPEEGLDENDRRLLREYSRTFIGSYQHSLDSKGRLIVPAVFRDQLGEKFCMAPSLDFQSIALYPNLMWARMRDRFKKLGSFQSGLYKYAEQLDALSYRDLECDSQGRILIPTKIRKQILGDEKDMEISGANDHVRIVSRTVSEKEFASFMGKLPDILEMLGALESGMGN